MGERILGQKGVEQTKSLGRRLKMPEYVPLPVMAEAPDPYAEARERGFVVDRVTWWVITHAPVDEELECPNKAAVWVFATNAVGGLIADVETRCAGCLTATPRMYGPSDEKPTEDDLTVMGVDLADVVWVE